LLTLILILAIGSVISALGLALADALGWIKIERPWSSNLKPRKLLALLVVVIAANGVAYGYVALRPSQTVNGLVKTYCQIGAASAAAQHRCETHVTATEIQSMNTPAAIQAQKVEADDCAEDPNVSGC
jgi:hypothetical protein